MDFSLFNVESTRGFASTFVDIYYDTSHPFRFPSIRKLPPPDILKLTVTTFINQYNKVSFIQVDEYGALAIYSEFMKTCHNMNIIVQTTGGYAFSIHGKNRIPNNTLDNLHNTG